MALPNKLRLSLPHPPQRIPGSDVVVTVQAEDLELGFSSFGVALIADLTPFNLKKGYEAATEDAIRRIGGSSNFLPNLLAFLEPTAEAIKQEKLKSVSSEEAHMSLLSRLQGPADQNKQREIKNLCLNLGITPIDILDPPITMLQALALRNCLAYQLEQVQRVSILPEIYQKEQP